MNKQLHNIALEIEEAPLKRGQIISESQTIDFCDSTWPSWRLARVVAGNHKKWFSVHCLGFSVPCLVSRVFCERGWELVSKLGGKLLHTARGQNMSTPAVARCLRSEE